MKKINKSEIQSKLNKYIFVRQIMAFIPESGISLLAVLALGLLLSACQTKESLADAYGNFETTPILVGVETPGRLLFLNVEEGQRLIKGELVALIDTMPVHLQMEKLLASKLALGQKIQESKPEIEVLQQQKQNLIREQKRVEALLKEKAATTKQLDDIKGQIQVLDQQMMAIQSKTKLANRAILSERGPVDAQLNLLQDQKQRCFIYNPISGTVVNKLAETSEVKGFGSPLYRIASLDTLVLRAYVTGTQLGRISLGEEVTVRIDAAEGTTRDYSGQISWVASQAEFTPKIIQTKEERVNLVYAIKVRVANDGYLKTGMPAEVWFSPTNIAAQ